MRVAFKWRSAAVGCGEQVLRERLGRTVAEGRMGSLVVVIRGPFPDRRAGVGPNRFHQKRTVSWLTSMPRSCRKS